MKGCQKIWAGPSPPPSFGQNSKEQQFFFLRTSIMKLNWYIIWHLTSFMEYSFSFKIFCWLHRYYVWKIGISMCSKMQLLEIRGSVSCREWGRVVAPSCLRHSSFLSGLKLAWSQLSQVFDLLPTRSKEGEGAAITIRQAAAMLPGRHCSLLLRQMICHRRPLSWNKL